jgi:hypothetical protein
MHRQRAKDGEAVVRGQRVATWGQVTTVAEHAIAHRSDSLHNGLRCSSLTPIEVFENQQEFDVLSTHSQARFFETIRVLKQPLRVIAL